MLTARRRNRATLARQLLLQREPVSVVDAVRRIVAVQAQEPASAYVALWNRVAGFDPSDLDAAFAAHSVVKATLMRITLHAVDVDDYPVFHEAMLPVLRAARLHDRRFAASGLSVADADALVPHLAEFASQPRSKAEVEDLLANRLGTVPDRGVWWALRTYAPLVHAPTDAPWSFGRSPSYLAAPTTTHRPDRDRCLQQLIRRYLEGFGPASAEDFAQFALQKRPLTREALRAMGDTLVVTEDEDGIELFDVPGALVPPEDTPAPPRLMAMWDSILLAYADRSRIIPVEYRKLVTRRNGDVLPTLLVDGYVAGVWRFVDDGIEALAFHRLPDDAWDGLATEAAGLLGLLSDRDPTAFRRYMHWWSTLPSFETRVLPAPHRGACGPG